MKKVSCLIICLAVTLGLGSPVSAAKPARTIKIGIVDCYRVPEAAMTCDVRDAFRLVVDEINSKGGILGRKIEFVSRDTMFDVEVGIRAAEKMILTEKVDILLGTINSSVGLAVSEIARREKVPFFSTFSKSAKITGEKGHRYVFGITENTLMAGKAAAVGLAAQPYVRYWIAGDDYEYGRAMAEGVWKNLKRLKPEVEQIGESWWKAGEPDLTPYLNSIMEAQPDAVVFATGGASMVNVMKVIKMTGLSEKIPLFIHTATELSVAMPLGREAPAGVIGTSNYHFYYPDSPENRAFVRAFKETYGRYPKVGALYGYLTAQFIRHAYEKAGKLDTEKFIDALEGITVDSPVGPVEMRACDHQAVLPMFMGVTKESSDYPFFVAGDLYTIPGPETMPTCEEIERARAVQDPLLTGPRNLSE